MLAHFWKIPGVLFFSHLCILSKGKDYDDNLIFYNYLILSQNNYVIRGLPEHFSDNP